MKVSLITVAYNSALTICDTFESVLSQTYSNIEYIIVDGGSKDNTVELIKIYEPKFSGKMLWVSEPDNGLYDAMNKGIMKSTGDVVGIINSDDLFCNDFAIEKVVNAFKTDSEIDGVYADLYYVSENDTSKIVRRWVTGERKLFKKGWHPAHPTLYLKKEIYNKYGLFDLDFKLAADFEIMLRFLDKHNIKTVYLRESLVKMRLGGTTNKNMKNIFNQNIECVRAFKKNDLKVNRFIYPFYRLFPKLLQFK